MLAKNPDSAYQETIHRHLDNGILTSGKTASSQPLGLPTHQPQNKLPYTSPAHAQQFVDGQTDGYLVVTVGLNLQNAEHVKFKQVAKQVKDFHNADIFSFDGIDFQYLREEIENRRPANVMFVIPPQLLDVNFQREVFKIAPTLDNDLFADFAWGYLTARDGDAVASFWDRIVKLHQNGLANKSWLESSVWGGNAQSGVEEGVDEIPAEASEAGFSGKSIHFGCVEAQPDVLKFVDQNLRVFEEASVIAMTGNGDPQSVWLFDDSRNLSSEGHWQFDPAKVGVEAQPDVLKFVDQNLRVFEEASVIAMTGNGDPQSVWLFDDSRNLSSEGHWQFDPAKVGQDPKDQLTRIKADRFRQLKLQSPIIWSGTCHSGASCRVYVEGDIVSTFGTSETTEVYELKPDESMGLALIDAGAGGLLVPVASNHGMAVSMETRFVVTHGATLGQAIKSTYDDVYFQAGGVPKLVMAKQGKKHGYFEEPLMQPGGANRILIGDPALAVFQPTSVSDEQVNVQTNADGEELTVELIWTNGFHPTGWSIYADRSGNTHRMNCRVDCSHLPHLHSGSLLISAVVANDQTGVDIPCQALVNRESINGKTYLHLEAIVGEETMNSAHRARFSIRNN